jgi:protein O-GlcNAc transferase
MVKIIKFNYKIIYSIIYILLLIVILFYSSNTFRQNKNSENIVLNDNNLDLVNEFNDTKLFILAQKYFNNNKVNLSKEHIIRAIEINSSNPNYYNLLFDISLRQNKVNDASIALINAIKLDPNKIRTKVDQGKLYMHQKKYSLAKKVFEKIIENNSNDPYAYSYLGFANYFTQDFENAKFYFNKSMNLIEIGNENPENFACPYEGLGMVYYKLNDHNKSEFFLNKSINFRPGIVNNKYGLLSDIYVNEKKLNKSLEILNIWEIYGNNDSITLFNINIKKSYIYYIMGKNNLTLNLLKKLENENIDPIIKYKNIGNVYQKIKEPIIAIKYFNKSLSYEPNNSEIYANIGYSYLFINKDNISKNYLKKSIKLDKYNDLGYAGLGNIYYKQKDYFNALINYNRSLSINPKNDIALLGMSNYFFKFNDYNKSNEYLKKSLNSNPYSPKAYRQKIEILRLTQPDRVLNIIEKDVLNHPDIFIYKLFYSSLLIEKGDYNKSLIIMSELINISSNGDPILYSELGFIYSLKKDYNNSIENYEKNIDLIDTSKYNYSFYSCPYDGLGMLYYELGNDNLTIQNLEKTIYLKPNSKSNRYEILIKLYLKHNNSEDAIRIARKWKEVNPIDYNLSKITHLIN